MVVGYNFSLIVISFGLNQSVPIERQERDKTGRKRQRDKNERRKKE
jgi:hypothetical protein